MLERDRWIDEVDLADEVQKNNKNLNQQGFGSGGLMLDEVGGLKRWFGDGYKEIRDLDRWYKRKREYKEV